LVPNRIRDFRDDREYCHSDKSVGVVKVFVQNPNSDREVLEAVKWRDEHSCNDNQPVRRINSDFASSKLLLQQLDFSVRLHSLAELGDEVALGQAEVVDARIEFEVAAVWIAVIGNLIVHE